MNSCNLSKEIRRVLSGRRIFQTKVTDKNCTPVLSQVYVSIPRLTEKKDIKKTDKIGIVSITQHCGMFGFWLSFTRS